MIWPKIREVKEALTSFFTKPYTSKFPAKAFEGDEGYRGFPKYFEEDCIGCGACAQVCPGTAIEMVDDVENKKRTLTVNYFSCMTCGQCEENCTTGKGIKNQYTLYSFSSPDKNDSTHFHSIEKELVLCESCGAVIACRDHLLYIKQKLGAKAFSHPNFLLETQRQFMDVPKSEIKEHLRREDYIKEVCPKCRHKIVVKDEF
jgi:hydrogenase-4 component H